MKRKKRVSRRQKPTGKKIAGRKIRSLRASGDEESQPWATGIYRPWHRPRKKRITLFLDADVLAWFKEGGPRYQTRINRALWKVMREEKRQSGK